MRRWLSETYGIIELVVASLAFWWGVRAIVPWGNIFELDERFAPLVNFVPFWAWGALAIGLSLLVIVSAIFGHMYVRRGVLGVMCGFFLFLVFIYFLGDYRSMVMLPWLHMAFVCATLLWMQR